MNEIKTIYEALPDDVKRKVSLHDLKRIADALNQSASLVEKPHPDSLRLDWRTDEPPKDGSTIVALGNITETDQDGEISVHPFTESVHWDDLRLLWMTRHGLALEGFYDSQVTIHHWLPQPD